MNSNICRSLEHRSKASRSHFLGVAKCSAMLLSLVFAVAGCKTAPDAKYAEATQSVAKAQAEAATPEKLLLREADMVRVSFPGAPNLNTVQQIRRDGKLALPLVGEVPAAGLSPSELEKKLLELYGPQLQTKELSVTLESSAFPVYVTGAVLRPGKITSDRPISALEAIMEAGGFDYTKANLKKVKVIRHENGQPKYYDLNLKNVMNGKQSQPFTLKPADIIYVPERFTWF